MTVPELVEQLRALDVGTPMGEILRKHWLPFLRAEQLIEPGGRPKRVRLLGEWLVAFRDTAGRLGLLDGLCPHEEGDLGWGFNREEGLVCPYHGLVLDVDGNCLAAPWEPPGRERLSQYRTAAYPVREVGGLLWTHLGDAKDALEMPSLCWEDAPADSWLVQDLPLARAHYLELLAGALGEADAIALLPSSVECRTADGALQRLILLPVDESQSFGFAVTWHASGDLGSTAAAMPKPAALSTLPEAFVRVVADHALLELSSDPQRSP